MWIIPNDSTNLGDLKWLLDKKIQGSRFTATTEVANLSPQRRGIKIECVRLRRKKDYCGAHPGPCLVNGRKHMRASYLEGLDWVGFNALLNDLLDEHKVDATVFSYNRESITPGRYYIRRGKRRRVGYPYDVLGGRFAHWTQTKEDLDDLFEDYSGKAPPPIEDTLGGLDGTPGYACYTLEEEDRFRAEDQEYDREVAAGAAVS